MVVVFLGVVRTLLFVASLSTTTEQLRITLVSRLLPATAGSSSEPFASKDVLTSSSEESTSNCKGSSDVIVGLAEALFAKYVQQVKIAGELLLACFFKQKLSISL